MNRELISQLDPLVEHLRGWVGSQLLISEAITRRPGNYDRHFTTSSVMFLRLQQVGVAFSGGALGLLGESPLQYEITIDLLESLAVGSREIILVERFGELAERRSAIQLTDEDHILRQ